MFGLFKKRNKTPQALSIYADLYDTMLYRIPDETPLGTMPTVYGFRVKDDTMSPDPRPDFVLLESDEEIQDWQQAMAGSSVLNEDGLITDAPLLKWNDIPSLLTAEDEIIATYFPVRADENWPALVVQAHPFGTALDIKPVRDRYYFQQNMVVGFM